MMLAHVECILVGILNEADDILLEFLISILSQSQTMGSTLSTAQVLSKKVLETCASQILLQQIIWSMDTVMHTKKNEIKEGQSDQY